MYHVRLLYRPGVTFKWTELPVYMFETFIEAENFAAHQATDNHIKVKEIFWKE